MKRRVLLAGFAGLVTASMSAHAASRATPEYVLQEWYGLILELVRHTPTYSPPVASRSFAYLGIALYEAMASGNLALRSLAGQLKDLAPLPQREDALHDEAVILHATMAAAAQAFFSNTGPTGKRAIKAMDAGVTAEVTPGVASDVIARSEAFGRAVTAHVVEWSLSDGGHSITNMGFPESYELGTSASSWKPTSAISMQQAPLLPRWGTNRPFAMPDGLACTLPPPPAYSEDSSSPFFAEAMEVYDVTSKLTDEQKLIARFWSDDPMLSPTPPGHWIRIVLDIAARDSLPIVPTVDVLARLGIAIADGFIACWQAKYQYDLLRPVTYIRNHINPKWSPRLITPPFPEYPSGHSTQSGAAAAVLTSLFGENFAFTDSTHLRDGIPAREFKSFWQAAEEAGISRLYGGIHFRSAIDQGLAQGRCVGAHAAALKTKA